MTKRWRFVAVGGLAIFCAIGLALAQAREPLPVPDVGPYRTLK